jgi:lipopolysaccharide transport system permease protein
MLKHMRTLYQYKDLLRMWTLREIKIRYKQSILGGAWAILQPLSLTLMFTIVFSVIVRVSTGDIPYPIFAYSALLPWTFLATSITFAVPSLVNNLNLVTKIYFPREILPVASVGAAFVDLLVASTIFLGMLLLYHVPLQWTLLYVPVLIAVQAVLILGVVLLASAINVFYRDVRFVVPLGLQLWFYASPVIYPLSLVPETLRPVYMLNPMAGLIDSYRRVILLGEPPVIRFLGPAVMIAVVLLLVGYRYFKRAEGQFADLI